MNRTVRNLALTAFILTPAVLVAALMWAIKAPTTLPSLGAAGSRPGSMHAGHTPSSPTPGGAASTASAAAQPGEKLVQPESLEQGYILVVEDKAKLASEKSPIYMAGTINQWNPGDQNFRLSPQSDGRWRIVMSKPTAAPTIEFKFTRGSWKLEELDANMKAPPNRQLAKIDISRLKPGEKPIIELSVAHWGDEKPDFEADEESPYKPLKGTGDLRRLEFIGGSGGAQGQMREAIVWLPPGYDDPKNAERRYPVLYLFDAQNLFQKHAGTPDEWGVDETATELIKAGKIEPLIVVGIPHGGAARMSEYMPVDAYKGVEPKGAEFLGLVVNQLMPRVERAFRVRTDAAGTAIGGSSLGAAMAILAVKIYPDRFGGILAESLPLGHAKWTAFVESVKVWPRRVYFGMGGREAGNESEKAKANEEQVAQTKQIEQRLSSAGLGADRKLFVIDAEAVHNEGAWKKRLPAALEFLFPPVK